MKNSFRTIEALLASGQFNRSWIARNAYVDPERRLFYVPTMKAACTAVKHFLRRLRTDEPVGFVPTAPEVSREMFIHDNSQMPYRTLGSFSADEIRAIVTAPGWFRFGIIRDPVDRFFSAWRDNVFLCRPGNERFRAQWAVLRPDEIAYTRLYALKDLSTFRDDIARHLATHGYAADLPQIPRTNEGYDIRPEGFIDAVAAERLHRFYAIDYTSFGLLKRPAPASEKRTAVSLTNAYTDAIFERHRVIAGHVYVSQLMAERERGTAPPMEARA